MSNTNEHKSYSREISQQSYNDANGHTHTNVTRTEETVNNVPNPNSYQNGYVHGRVAENHYQEEVLSERDNENASRGLLLGILLTSLAALTAGTVWFLNQRNNEVVEPVAPIVVPAPDTKPDPKPPQQVNQPPKQETTIIEKIKEVPVPVAVPQKQAPAPQPSAPAPQQNVNITVPNPASQQPAAQEAPKTQPAPTQPQSQRSSADAQGTQSNTSTGITTPDRETQSNTDTTTPDRGASSETDTTSGSSSSPTDAGNTSDSAQ